MVTKSEHERERRAFWDRCCAETPSFTHLSGAEQAKLCARIADFKLRQRDKRFPAPEESEEK